MAMRDADLQPDEFDREVTRLVAATADETDPRIDRAVREVLRLVREHLEMEVAFVSQLTQGQRVFRAVDTQPGKEIIASGGSDPLEMSFCQRVLEGRLPELVRDITQLPDFQSLPATPWPIGAHLSTPIVLNDGAVYGTLCCFSSSPDEDLSMRDLKRLRMAAQMVARLLDKQRRGETNA